MEFNILTIFLATLGLVWYYIKWQKKKAAMKGLKEIPGPWGLPFIGNSHQLGKDMNKQFTKWSEQYGDIYQVKLGPIVWIVVSEPKMVKEIFSVDPLLTGRINVPTFEIYEDNPGLGIFSSEGELWEVHRRFLIRQLRDFGLGKSSMENMIMDELEEVIAKYKKLAGTPVSHIRETMGLAVVNSLWKILSSQRFDHDDPELMKLANNTSKGVNEASAKIGFLLFMPGLMKLFPKISGYGKLRDIFDENRELFERTIKEHEENFDPDDLKDFIDAYLAEAKKPDPSSKFSGEYGIRQLVTMLFELFLAGSDSTAIVVAWCVHLMCKFPNCQKKLQQEITNITDNSRKVSVADKVFMPYTLALIDEILRFASITPDGVQHKAMATTQFRGYYIPKNAVVQPNFSYINHSERFFKDANIFKPERFLSPDGLKYVKDENLNPFQVGRRQCVGETLARDTIFLYLSNFFQNFNVKFDPSKEEPGFDHEIGILRAPLPFSVIMTERI